jgi:hypothetical protein
MQDETCEWITPMLIAASELMMRRTSLAGLTFGGLGEPCGPAATAAAVESGSDRLVVSARAGPLSQRPAVGAQYHAGRDDVDLLGWITGAELLERQEIRRFTTINNYTAPYEALH